MAQITGLTRGGTEWIPAFVTELNPENCIGCGRCFNVCPRDVFELVERTGDLLANAEEDLDDDDFFGDDEDDDFSDDTSMVMSLKDAMDCIGCEACSRVCPKDCMTHAAA